MKHTYKTQSEIFTIAALNLVQEITAIYSYNNEFHTVLEQTNELPINLGW